MTDDAFLGVTASASGKRWRLRQADERLGQAHAQALEVPEILGRLLAAREVPLGAGASYLKPTLKDLLPDPSVLRDMDCGAGRLADAVVDGQPIAIFGDYDVDGATSSALLARFLRSVGGDVRVYIPDRLIEGYGPNAPALLKLADEGARVAITVDCGISAFEPLQAAADAGLDVIVVDHHEAEAALPVAFAVINPNRLDEDRALGYLAAVGVAYLLVVATNRELRLRGWYQDKHAEPDLLQWLDIVALGTVCDVVPLKGLNRAFVFQGLKVMARRGNAGLAALSDVAGLDRKPEAYHAGFVLGPRINAGGRVGRADLGAALLSSDDAAQAAAMAAELDHFNAERRTIEALVQEQAIEQVEQVERSAGALGPLVVASADGWHPGVIGIVASRLKDRFNLPAFVIAFDDEAQGGGQSIGKGSGRSVRGVDLGAAVIAARQAGLLINGGGHAMAAGLTVARDKFELLVAFLNERLAGPVSALGAVRSLGLDGALAVGGATTDLIELLHQAGPFGSANPEPRFAITAARVVKANVVGQGHVSCIFTGRGGGRLKGIAFRSAETPLGACLLAAGGREVHVAGHLRIDEWQGRRQAQIFIDDVIFADQAKNL
jgi:single-stranded-DNA-specific exonuclease